MAKNAFNSPRVKGQRPKNKTIKLIANPNLKKPSHVDVETEFEEKKFKWTQPNSQLGQSEVL